MEAESFIILGPSEEAPYIIGDHNCRSFFVVAIENNFIDT